MFPKFRPMAGKAAEEQKILDQDPSHDFARNTIQKWESALAVLHQAIQENEKGWDKIWLSYSALHSAVDAIYPQEDGHVRSITQKLHGDSAMLQNNGSHDAPKALSDSKRQLHVLRGRIRKTETLQAARLDMSRKLRSLERKANEAERRGAHDRVAQNRNAAAEVSAQLIRATDELFTELESIDSDRLQVVDRAVRAILEMQKFFFTSNPVGKAMDMAADLNIGGRIIPQGTTIDWGAYKPTNICAPGQSGSLAPYPGTPQQYPYGAPPPYRPQGFYLQQHPNVPPYHRPTPPSSQPYTPATSQPYTPQSSQPYTPQSSQPYAPQGSFPYNAPSPTPGPYIPPNAAPPPQQYPPPPSGHSTPSPPAHKPTPSPGIPPPPPPDHPPPPPDHPPPPLDHPPPPRPGHQPPPPHGHIPPPPPTHPPSPPTHPPPPPTHPPQGLGIAAPNPIGLQGGATSPVQNQPGPPANFPGNYPPGPGNTEHLYQPSAPLPDPPGTPLVQPPRPSIGPPRPGEIRPGQSAGLPLHMQHGARPTSHPEVDPSQSPSGSSSALAGGHGSPVAAGNPSLQPGGYVPGPPVDRPPELQVGSSSPVPGAGPVSGATGHSPVAPTHGAANQGGPVYPPKPPFGGKPGQGAGYAGGAQAMAASSGYGAGKPGAQQGPHGYILPATPGQGGAQGGSPALSQGLTAGESGPLGGVDGVENDGAGTEPLPSEMAFLSGYVPATKPEGMTGGIGAQPQSSQDSYDDSSSFEDHQALLIAKIDVGDKSAIDSSYGMVNGQFPSGSQYLPPEVQLSRPPPAAGGVGPSQNLVAPPGYPMVEPGAKLGVNQGNVGARPVGSVCYLPKPPSLYPGNSGQPSSGPINQWPNVSHADASIGVGAKIQYNRSGSRGSSSVSGDDLSKQVSSLDIKEEKN